jgi:hypothetical protein
MWRDDECETAVKENDGDGWTSDYVVWRMQNRDTIGWWREWLVLR